MHEDIAGRTHPRSVHSGSLFLRRNLTCSAAYQVGSERCGERAHLEEAVTEGHARASNYGGIHLCRVHGDDGVRGPNGHANRNNGSKTGNHVSWGKRQLEGGYNNAESCVVRFSKI